MSIAPPPSQSIEAERGILSGILQGVPVPSDLSPSDFFHALHCRVFSQMRRLAETSEPITILTLYDSMTLDQVETAEVAALLSPELLVRKADDVASYARRVKAHSLRRDLAKACERLIQSKGDAPGLAAELEVQAQRYLKSLSAGELAWREMFHTFEEFEGAGPLSFAIDGFLQTDGATMIGGLSGHGKTLILASVAKALLAGKGARLWNLFTVAESAVRVIYLIPECSLAPFRHRLQLFGLYDHLRPEDGRLLVRTLSKGPTPCLSDPRILFAAKGAHVILDTAVRFSTEGDENSAGDNQRGLASDIFALLGAGARSVLAAHHSPKPFAKENVMRLENVLRGSGDIGAMLTTAWGIKQLDVAQNIIHIENVKPRDFQPCAPFQIIGRPHIDTHGDFALLKEPGQCGSLMDEQEPQRDKGGAPQQVREARAANLELLRGWLGVTPTLTSHELSRRFTDIGIKLGDSAIRKYRKDLGL